MEYKDFLNKNVIPTKKELYRKVPIYRKKLPQRIPIGMWFQFDERTRMAVFPAKPCNSGISGVIQTWQNPNHFAEWKETWKWEFIHERGDAKKLGKTQGLVFLKGDPLLLPLPHKCAIYALIYGTLPEDFYQPDKTEILSLE